MPTILRQEDADTIYLITTRTNGSRLWFVNHRHLENRILAFLARYQELYGVKIYAFVLQGNHYHLLASFPYANRAAFQNAFNSMVARLVAELVGSYRHGRLWARRYSAEAVITNSEVKNRFFYCALNATNAGLGEQVTDYPGYNTVWEAARGEVTTHRVFLRWQYNKAKSEGRKPNPADYIVEHKLEFSRLPDHEDIPAEEYRRTLIEELEIRRTEIVRARKENNQGFATRKTLLNTKQGTFPKSTKQGSLSTRRPLFLSDDPAASHEWLADYFSYRSAYKEASRAYRQGDLTADFPLGSYRPPLGCVGRVGPVRIKPLEPPSLQTKP